MGKLQDSFKQIGIVGSTGTTISNAGQKLISLGNELKNSGKRKK